MRPTFVNYPIFSEKFHIFPPLYVCAVLSHSVVSNSCTIACQAPLSMGILQARILEWVSMLSSEDLSNLGIEPRSFTLQADSSPSEPPGRPKNTGMDSLSLQEGNFLTLELNQVILHCRQILYHLNYQGYPHWT